MEKLCAPCLNITPVCVPSALAVGIEESAERLMKDLAERAAYEQSLLKEVLGFAGLKTKKSSEEGPVFNAFVNILSPPPDEILDGNDDHDKEIKKEKDILFTPYHLSHSEAASLYTSSSPVDESMPASTETSTYIHQEYLTPKTAIDGLETGYLSDKNFYLDVVREEKADSINFAVKCEAGLMSVDQVRAFMMEMVAEVQGFLGNGKEEDGVIVGSGNASRESENNGEVGEDVEDRKVGKLSDEQRDGAIADVGGDVVEAVDHA
ncbi:MAG: hypothetical protein Q9180_006798 [Flavoplaca navasiana]